MHTKSAISVTIGRENADFLENIAKRESKTKSEIVDSVLDFYRKFNLKRRIIAGFEAQTRDDVDYAMSEFGDYLNLIDSCGCYRK